ncbi:cytochrome ubiquinol oxidase subunit I [Nocardioides convexus]|uniref:cytochrome ubiquinol oxidase subunit I n=1 Tax=Nocardioides convexus TaxID=2712224 RepID=UPI0024182228|nr:cytochrome ubiquinol oxidase subunit I [Nocardioides convexus]
MPTCWSASPSPACTPSACSGVAATPTTGWASSSRSSSPRSPPSPSPSWATCSASASTSGSPPRLAAFELADTTESPSPLRLGGIMVDGEVKYSIDIPYLGSLIAMNSPDKPVPGLDTIPEEDHPPVNMTHLAFQTMVGIGTLLAAAVVLFWVQRRRGRDLLEKRWFLRFAAVAGPLAVIALEAGWIATEVGRQPWIVYDVMRTTDAVGDYTASLWWLLGISTVVYTGMTVGAVVVLRSMARRWREGAVDLPSPYAPATAEGQR